MLSSWLNSLFCICMSLPPTLPHSCLLLPPSPPPFRLPSSSSFPSLSPFLPPSLPSFLSSFFSFFAVSTHFLSHFFSFYLCLKLKVKVTQSCLTLCDPMDYTVHGILQARILEWVAVPFSRGSSQPRNRTQVSCIAGGFFTS